MRSLLRFLTLGLLLGIALPAAAMPYISERTTVLSAVALNASAGTRTFSIMNPSGAYLKANLEMQRTRVAGTDLTLTCVKTTSDTTPPATPTGVMTACVWDATGVCTSVTATLKSTTSVTETLAWELDISGYTRTDCTVASTSAGGTDLITTILRLVGW